MNRRRFLTGSMAAAAAAWTGAIVGGRRARAKAAANDRVSVAVVGVRGRGGGLLTTFASLADVDVKYVCDVDRRVLDERVAGVARQTGRRPQAIGDFRRALDDGSVDALVLGTPDHWHAIPTILACQAGKDVYVEKPDGHNVIESLTMAAAAHRHGRVVQLGTQARSGPHLQSAMQYIAKGSLGRVRFAKAWESTRQGSIGHVPDGPVPEGVDYDMWLGPAPQRPFNRRRFHSTWRWFFDYGTGDLGNDGVHRLDIARWALQTALAAEGKQLPALPRSVSAHGGKYYFDDDQQWPDTLMVTYDFPGCVLTYEMRVWSRYPMEGEGEGAGVYGDGGYIVLGNGRWRAFDLGGNEVASDQGSYNDVGHARNFIDCMRSREKPTADLETVGHPSSMLCHLGNLAWRAGRTVRFDPKTRTCLGDQEADVYLTRAEYRRPWGLPEIAELH
ncbi:MAG: Gfo/Idh/MocA family oxidoreductase [Pirellulales bacterium]|nr:Gfo/Idh/MocA family oxidoreductase [Pirellulales bacterium]